MQELHEILSKCLGIYARIWFVLKSLHQKRFAIIRIKTITLLRGERVPLIFANNASCMNDRSSDLE